MGVCLCTWRAFNGWVTMCMGGGGGGGHWMWLDVALDECTY